MILHKTEVITIPQTEAGKRFADDYSEGLRRQGVLDFVQETTTSIKIQATYHFNMIASGEICEKHVEHAKSQAPIEGRKNYKIMKKTTEYYKAKRITEYAEKLKQKADESGVDLGRIKIACSDKGISTRDEISRREL